MTSSYNWRPITAVITVDNRIIKVFTQRGITRM